MTIQELIQFKESENKVEFKEAKGGNFSYNGGSRIDPKERRRCILGYVTAFANEGGGYLVLGVSDKYPHQVVGTTQCLDATGKLEQDIYNATRIRTEVSTLIDENGNRVLIIKINARPIGKLYKFEDVPLMRIGEELLPMSDEKYRSIIQEQEPDFSESICDGLTVELRISGLVQDKAFALFIKSVQNELPDDKKLSVFEIIALNRVRKGVIKTTELPQEIIKSLIEKGLIEQQGKTKGSKLILSRAYYEFTGEKGKYTKSTDLNDQQVFILILEHLSKFEKAKMNDFVDIFSGRLTRKQVRYIVDKLVGSKELKRDGVGKSTIYSVGENFLKTMTLLNKALDIGMKHLRENGELDHEK